jgi:alpha-L-fucosidase
MSSSAFRYTRRRLLAAAGIAGATAATGVLQAGAGWATAGPSSYTPTWASVDQHPAAPEWFQDAKFGIYWHWGVFTTPEYGYEWYGREMYNDGTGINTHHKATYGDPRTQWGYDKFIDGGVDKAGNRVQFRPVLKAQGGKFDPDEWVQLFKNAGARIGGPVAEHHDGYSMWDSQVNEWNSVDRGPRLDLLKLFADAVRRQNMKLFVAMHQSFNYNGFFRFVPPQSDPSLQKLYGQLSRAQEDQLWFDKLKEVIDQAQPDIIYHDFALDSPGYCHGDSGPCAVAEQQRLNFLAYYFNKGVEWGKDVVTTYKHFDRGFHNASAVEDYERGGPADLVYPYWQTDESIASGSWSYTKGLSYYSSQQMIHQLIDRVSKNGNMMLNVAPTAEGEIPQAQRNVLNDFGVYLNRNGESIYSTRAWAVYGEGPTKMGGGSFVTPKAGTNTDIRFTRTKDNRVLYATVLGWPSGTLTITTLSSNRINLGTLTSVQLLGSAAGTYVNLPSRTQDGSGLRITMPANAPYSAPAYVVKLTFSGAIPALSGGGGTVPTGWARIANVATGLVLDSGGNVSSGSQLKQWNSGTSTNLQWQLVDAGGGYYRLVNRTNGMVADSWGDTANGAAAKQAAWSGGNNQQWRLTSMGNGRYQIINRGTGTCLDSGGDTTAGSGVKLWAPQSSTNLQWTITAV